MKCANPYMYKTVVPFGCGQCMHYRINKHRLIQHRLMLESMCHSMSCMVTCTYDPKFLPANGSLDYRDHTLFLKRLRERYPGKIRFYGVGEYGSKSMRPHYHYALFGIGKDSHDLIQSAWGKGHIDTGYEGEAGRINKDSAQYICGYVTKKMTSWTDPKVKSEFLAKGLLPERPWSSNRPGIGALVVPSIVKSLSTPEALATIDRVGDVPMVLKHSGKRWPLGRYLRKKIREAMGFQVTGAQEGWYEQCKARAEEEMLELCVSEGVIGLIQKEEETELSRLTKVVYQEKWRKVMLQRRNIPLNKTLEVREKEHKRLGRSL